MQAFNINDCVKYINKELDFINVYKDNKKINEGNLISL